MPSDLTLFQFDVDERTVRRLLSSVPGVTPLPPDERAGADGDDDHAETDAPSTDVPSTAATPVDDEPGVTDGRPARSAGVETHLDGTGTTSGDSGESWGRAGPSTPWPGAPVDEEGEDGGIVARLGGRKVVLAAGLVLALGVIGGAALWYFKLRGDGEPGESEGDGEDVWSGPRPDDPAAESTPTRESGAIHDRGDADEADGRYYPVDVSPVVGIGFLAVAALVVRRFRATDDA